MNLSVSRNSPLQTTTLENNTVAPENDSLGTQLKNERNDLLDDSEVSGLENRPADLGEHVEEGGLLGWFGDQLASLMFPDPTEDDDSKVSSLANRPADLAENVEEGGLLGRIGKNIEGSFERMFPPAPTEQESPINVSKTDKQIDIEAKTVRQINLEKRQENSKEIAKQVKDIEDELRKLNKNIYDVCGVRVHPENEDRIDEVEFSKWEKFSKISNYTGALFTTTQNTLYKLTWAAALPAAGTAAGAVAGMAGGGVVTSLSLKATSYLMAGYLGLKALSEIPDENKKNQVEGYIKSTSAKVGPMIATVIKLRQHEIAQEIAAARTALIMGVRSARIETLQAQLVQVDKALTESPRAEQSSVPRHAVTQSDGAQRSQTLLVAERRYSFFEKYFPRFIVEFFTRWSAARAENDYEKKKLNTLSALKVKAGDSLVNGLDIKAAKRSRAAGAKVDAELVRSDFIMGENLTLALLRDAKLNFGFVAYNTGSSTDKDKSKEVLSVAATLTSARAIACYLEAIADLPEEQRKECPDAPKVTRNKEDGSLNISDPSGKINSFLKSVGVAYTPAMAGQEDGELSAALMINDHRQGMPLGMNSMKFEQVLDSDGKETQLKMSFLNSEKYLPVFTPLASENKLLFKLYEALHTASSPGGAEVDLSNFRTEKELLAYKEETIKELTREKNLLEIDRQEIRPEEDWRNSKFNISFAEGKGQEDWLAEGFFDKIKQS